MLVSLSSCRGAPGVSSWALTLATAWPHSHDRVLVEADCSGGVFGGRYDVAVEPGSAELVSQARRGRFDSDLDLTRFARHVRTSESRDSELWVVPSPLSSHESLDVWRAMAAPTAEAMAHDDRLWLADCGRVWHRSPVEALLAIAPLSIVVSDHTMPSLLVLKARIESLPHQTAIIVVGDMQYTTDDLIDFTGADYVWNVPFVRRLDSLAAEFATSGRARRSRTWRTALGITQTLATGLQPAGRIAPSHREIHQQDREQPDAPPEVNGSTPETSDDTDGPPAGAGPHDEQTEDSGVAS